MDFFKKFFRPRYKDVDNSPGIAKREEHRATEDTTTDRDLVKELFETDGDVRRALDNHSDKIRRDLYERMGITGVGQFGTALALEYYENRFSSRAEKEGIKQDDNEMFLNIQKQLVGVEEELLQVMRSEPEIYTPEDIRRQEEKVDIEKKKLQDLLVNLNGEGSCEINGGEEDCVGDDENIVIYTPDDYCRCENYDTPQESNLKSIIGALEGEIEKITNRTQKDELSQAIHTLEMMLKEAKRKRSANMSYVDPGIQDRKPDKLGNPTELTLVEKANGIIESLKGKGCLPRGDIDFDKDEEEEDYIIDFVV